MTRAWQALAVAAWLALGTGHALAEHEVANVLAVQGEGTIAVPPDLAYVRIGVTAQAARAAEAQAAVNAVAQRIRAGLEKLEVEKRDVQTVQLQIGPYYAGGETVPAAPTIAGYEASNVVRVTVRDLTRLGAIVDSALGAGGNRVDGVDFALRDERDARKEALRRAVADARAKGAAMSEALGTKLGPVRSLRETGSAVEPLGPVSQRMVADSMAATPTTPGEIAIRAQVLLEYTLE